MLRTTCAVLRSAAVLLLSCIAIATASAQVTSREMKIEVRDRDGHPIAGAQVVFFLTNDSTRTDSSGLAKITIKADSIVDIAIRKIGFEQRQARFKVGRATGFTIRVELGDATQKLAEVEVREDLPAEPWRKAFEARKKRGGGHFRDISNFASRMPNTIDDWFAGLPGVRTGGGAGNELNVPRCLRLGLWVDGQHATSPGSDYRFALATIPAQDIAAFELYMSNTPAQYTGYAEDCSLLIWTRFR
jgi:hypothetical protein